MRAELNSYFAYQKVAASSCVSWPLSSEMNSQCLINAYMNFDLFCSFAVFVDCCNFCTAALSVSSCSGCSLRLEYKMLSSRSSIR